MKNALTWLCKIFLTLSSLMLLYAGFMWSFFPDANLAANSIEVSNALGINMIKSDIGAPLLAGGVFLLLFVFQGNRWFLPMLILGGAYFIVRTISFFVDGSHQMIIFGIVLEGLVLVALYSLYKLRKDT